MQHAHKYTHAFIHTCIHTYAFTAYELSQRGQRLAHPHGSTRFAFTQSQPLPNMKYSMNAHTPLFVCLFSITVMGLPPARTGTVHSRSFVSGISPHVRSSSNTHTISMSQSGHALANTVHIRSFSSCIQRAILFKCTCCFGGLL